MSLGKRIGTLLRLFLLIAVLMTIAIVSAITTIRLIIHGHQETMPNLVSMSFDGAQRMASGLGLELVVEDKLYSTQYPANEVISQMPPAGTRVKLGQHAHVLLSLGQPRENIPNLVGGSLRAAQIQAIQTGLSVGDIAAVHWATTLPDEVVAQDPPPATADVHSPSVNLLISLGNPSVSYLCPSFIDQTIGQVQSVLEKAGFKIGQVTPFPTSAVPAGVILSQSPAPGSKISSDSVFTFQVSRPTGNP